MKQKPRRGFATALVTTATATALVTTLSSCGSDFEYGPYLRGLEEHCEEVTSHLVSEGVDAHCDDDSWAVIVNDGAAYTASNDGIQSIKTDVASIAKYGILIHGKMTSITVMVGGGYDAPKAIYYLKNLSDPSAFYTGDNLDWVQSTIEAAISTDEMKSLVAQAERYQQLMRAELDKLT